MDTQEIIDHADSISLQPAALANQQTEFCRIWPTAKQALTLLAELLTNIVVKKTIRMIIAAGDAVAGRICK